MKYILLPVTLLFSALNAAQAPQMNKWNPKLYEQGSSIQEREAKKMMEKAKIYPRITNKDVLDVGSGLGNIPHFLVAEKQALSVHGIDASDEMTKWAQNSYIDLRNKLSFTTALAEEYLAESQFDFVVSFFCLHWVKNVEQAFHNIYSNLKPDCEFFGTIRTQSDKIPVHIEAFLNTAVKYEKKFPFIAALSQNLTARTGCHIMDDGKLKSMLENIGFEIISIDHSPMRLDFKGRDEVKRGCKAIFLSTPLAQLIPEDHKEAFLDAVVDELMTMLDRDGDGYFATDSNTVLHLRKK